MASCFFQGASCPERVSWPLSCGVGCLIEAEKGGGQKFLPRRTRVPWQVAFFKGLAAQRTCPGLCPVAWGVVGAQKGAGQEFLPQRNRIPEQMVSFKGLAAESACLGLCPVAWGAI